MPAAPPAVPPPIIIPTLAPPPPAPAPSVAPAAAAPPPETLEWDDDEMATQIYERQMLMETARQQDAIQIDTSSLSATAAPVPAKLRAPERPVLVAPAPRKSATGVVVAAILGIAIVASVAIVILGREKKEDLAPGAVSADVVAVAPQPELDAGQAAEPSVDAAVAPPVEAGPATAPAKTVVVGLAEELKAATISVDGARTEWKPFLKVEIPAGGPPGRSLEIAWPGRRCKAPATGGCPAWRIDETTQDFQIGPGDFVAAPIRVALQGMLIEEASLFSETKTEGSTTSTFENVAIQVEGQASYIALLPGTHALVVRRTGFPDFALPPFAVPEDPAAARPLPVPLLVALEVSSTPDDARVLLARGSGEPRSIGVTGAEPVRALVDRAQSYRIRIVKSGYKAFEQALSFAEGAAMLALAPTLERAAREPPRPPPPPSGPTGKLTVVTQPWTMVYIDGRRIKQTPLLNHDLRAGRYQLTLLNQEAGIRHTEMIIIQADRTTMIRRTQDQMR